MIIFQKCTCLVKLFISPVILIKSTFLECFKHLDGLVMNLHRQIIVIMFVFFVFVHDLYFSCLTETQRDKDIKNRTMESSAEMVSTAPFLCSPGKRV